ncbi:MAG: transporter [Fibrobacteraceae bacterium]|nr:transporter [Fibrobacteraceae bacterium]
MVASDAPKKFTKPQWAKFFLWVALHGFVVFFAFYLWPLKINQDLFSILPESAELKEIASAERELSARTLSKINLFVGHQDFDIAKKAANCLEAEFSSDSSFEDFRLKIEENDLNELKDFIYSYRYSLQGSRFAEELANGTTALEEEALQRTFGAFSISNLSHIEEDPFLLSERAFDRLTLHSPLIPKNLTLKENYLVAKNFVDSATTGDTLSRQFIFVSATLSQSVSSFASDNHVLAKLENKIDSLEKKWPGLVVAKSGVPFHSFESSRNAQGEILWISGVSIFAILILLLYVFKTPLPIGVTIGSLCVALISAMCGTWAIFRQIHIFTFVFGTTVIGIGIDYSLHFWIHHKFELGNAQKRIFKSLSLGFLTTLISYATLTLSNFPLLQQMAAFASIGLASVYLTTNLIYPQIAPKKNSISKAPLFIPNQFLSFYKRINQMPRALTIAISIIFIASMIPGFIRLHVQTDLQSLYKMSNTLLQGEKLSNQILDFGSSGFYFIIKGATPQEVLETEEILTDQLFKEVADSSLKNFIATSLYIPSQKSQLQSFQLAKEKLLPNAQNLLLNLGFNNDEQFRASLDSNPSLLTPDTHLPKQWKELLHSLWLGKIQDFKQDSAYYSVVMPLHVKNVDKIKSLPQQLNKPSQIFSVDKMGEINKTLTHLSQAALRLVLVVYILIFALLAFVYNPVDAFRIIRAPLLATALTASIFGYCNIPFNIFAVSGIILILGIGIDYSLFFKEGFKGPSITTLSILVSAATTIFSFGTLAFSSFTPVFSLGLAVFIGILASLLLAPLSRN